jgi:hypothetical protein
MVRFTPGGEFQLFRRGLCEAVRTQPVIKDLNPVHNLIIVFTLAAEGFKVFVS